MCVLYLAPPDEVRSDGGSLSQDLPSLYPAGRKLTPKKETQTQLVTDRPSCFIIIFCFIVHCFLDLISFLSEMGDKNPQEIVWFLAL